MSHQVHWTFSLSYLAASVRARHTRRHWYHDNPYEVAARKAAKRRQT